MARLPISSQPSISEGVKSNCRLAPAMVVIPWRIAGTSADFRRAVYRSISSTITMLIGMFPVKLQLSRKSLGHYSDIGRADLIRPLDRAVFQQRRADLVYRRWQPSTQRSIVRMDAYLAPQAMDTVATHREAGPHELFADTARAHPRPRQVQFVDPERSFQIRRRLRPPSVIYSRTPQPEHLPLPRHAQLGPMLDHRFAFRFRDLRNAF